MINIAYKIVVYKSCDELPISISYMHNLHIWVGGGTELHFQKSEMFKTKLQGIPAFRDFWTHFGIHDPHILW